MNNKIVEWNLLSPMLQHLFLYYQGRQNFGKIDPLVFVKYGLKARGNVGGVDWMKTSLGRRMLDYIDTLLLFSREEIPETLVNPNDGKTYYFIDFQYVGNKLYCNYATARSLKDYDLYKVTKIYHVPLTEICSNGVPTIDVPDLDTN